VPEPLLNALKLLLLALVYLFFLRVLRAVWVQVTAPATGAPAPSDTTARGTGPAVAAVAHLRVVEPAAEKGRTYDLSDEVTVGRASGCQVALTDPTVSQLHARIFRRDGKLFVEDLGSSNGTFLNRKKIGAPTALRRGDRLAFGSTILEVTR
jgi:pSer/pThr/pTyr-binding forkhead associated (FHA) protein